MKRKKMAAAFLAVMLASGTAASAAAPVTIFAAEETVDVSTENLDNSDSGSVDNKTETEDTKINTGESAEQDSVAGDTEETNVSAGDADTAETDSADANTLDADSEASEEAASDVESTPQAEQQDDKQKKKEKKWYHVSVLDIAMQLTFALIVALIGYGIFIRAKK